MYSIRAPCSSPIRMTDVEQREPFLNPKWGNHGRGAPCTCFLKFPQAGSHWNTSSSHRWEQAADKSNRQRPGESAPQQRRCDAEGKDDLAEVRTEGRSRVIVEHGPGDSRSQSAPKKRQ